MAPHPHELGDPRKRSRSPSPAHLSGADGLRAIACLAVISHHYSQRLSVSEQPEWILELQSFLVLGNTGVSIFFVLSGFLLSLPFWRAYLAGGAVPSMRDYLLRRAARIVPGYYAALLTSIGIAALLQVPIKNFWERLLTGLTFTSGFHYTTFFPTELNAPLWSISFETFSYLLMPFFMVGLFTGFRRSRSLSLGLLYWTGILLLIVSFNQLIQTFLLPDMSERGWEFGLTGGAKAWMPRYNPIGFFGHFAVGILAAGVTTGLNRPSDHVGRFRQAGGFDLVALASLIAAGAWLWAMRHGPDFSFSLQQQPFYFPYFTLVIAVALAVLPLTTLAGPILDNRLFRYTAQVSFGLYIWHYPIIAVANAWSDNFISAGIPNVKLWLVISSGLLVASYVVATLSYRLIEKPVIDWAHRKKT